MNIFFNSTFYLVLSHIGIICLSNILVQYPFELGKLSSTWGALSYPLIFILTDLTIRILGQKKARLIIFKSMAPSLLLSYLISNAYRGEPLLAFNSMILRVSFGSFFSYVIGQLLDITIFRKLMLKGPWWLAPSVSIFFGNFFDSYCFFGIAFYASNDPFLSSHWAEMATMDYAFKIGISLFSFIPLYGFLMNRFFQKKESVAVV